MQLSLTKTLPCGVIFPHVEQGRSYYLLFHTPSNSEPLYVKTSDLENPSLFHIGDICAGSYEGPVVGNCFFTQAQHIGRGGVFCIAYTGVLGKRVDSGSLKNLDLGLELSLKTPNFMMWNKRGAATVIVTPSLADTLKESLET
jgi:hypothetical protein